MNRGTVGALALLMVGLSAATTHAFCGFYVSGADSGLVNKATMVVMMREGSRTVLSMQNNYEGPPSNFAMVVPVPVVLQEENVKVLENAVFERVDHLASPRLVEYWEQDPCYVEPPRAEVMYEPEAMEMAAPAAAAGAGDHGVTIEAQFAVGEYEVVILSARDSGGLDAWLRENEYSIPEGAEPVLRPYVEAGMKFFVAKVDITKVTFEDGRANLSPLRFHYDSDTFSLPVRLGLLNSSGTQDLIVHILAPNQRYELANYNNVTIPTNIDVADEVRTRFGEFYAALFDETMSRNQRAIVTEYAWQATNCDPCPGPVLSSSDIYTLGADALPTFENAARDDWSVMGQLNNFVLTRLHTRYDRDALDEDLVFRAAPPIVGGREIHGPNGLEHGASESHANNFQGRYAIRHEWTGPIECENPQRGRWGGPPANTRPQETQPATDLAYAPRGQIQLQEIVRSDVPELAITAVASLTPTPATEAVAEAVDSAEDAAESAGGCMGCSVGSPATTWGMLAFGAALVMTLRRKRR